MRTKIAGIWQIAAVYVGTVVGAGFATGREIVEFFTKYGFWGFVGILLAGYLFIIIGTKMMLVAVSIQAKTYEDFNLYLFGRKWSPFINILFFIMLFGVTAVMLSGAGAVFEEQLGIPKMIGVAATSILALITLHNGIKGLFMVNMLVVPAMILFSLLLFVQVIGKPQYIQDFTYIPADINFWKSMLSPFLYSAFNLALAQAVLVPVAYEVQDSSIIKKGGLLGGLCLTIILLTSHLSLITLPSIIDYDIPSAELMKSVATPLYLVFIFVIYGEIFTSLVGNIFGLEKQIQQYINLKPMFVFIAILLAAYSVSFIPYRTLLSSLYPLFGYISLLFLILLFRSKPK